MCADRRFRVRGCYNPLVLWLKRLRRTLITALARRFRRRALRRRAAGPEAALAAARRILSRKKYCVLCTRSELGVDARVVQPFWPDEQLCVWMGTSRASRKAAQIARCAEVTLVYEDDARAACVTLVGRAQLVLGPQEELRRRFMPLWYAFFPGGPLDGDFALIRFEPYRLEVIDFTLPLAPDPFGVASLALERDGAGWREAQPGLARSRPNMPPGA